MMPSLHEVAQALGGEVRAGRVLAPAPGHSPADRGMSIKLSDDAPDGFLVKLFNEGDPIAAKDFRSGPMKRLPRLKSAGPAVPGKGSCSTSSSLPDYGAAMPPSSAGSMPATG
jgi:hypothetical protein